MTASQPPQPPVGGPQPGPGTPPPYGQPTGSGQPGPTPPTGFPAPGHGPQPMEGNQQPPGAASPFGPQGGGFSMDLKKLRMADYVIAGGTVLYLILGVLPWIHFGFGFVLPGVDTSVDISGFSFSSMVSFSFVLFLLATAWVILPAFYSLEVGFPRSYVTVGLAGLGLLLTLFAWIRSLSYEFKIVPLLALLTAVAIALFAVFTLLPELRDRPSLPGGLAKAGQWANQRGPEFGQQSGAPSAHAGPPPVVPPQQQYAPPPQAPPVPPASPGGWSAPGAGPTSGAGSV